MLPSKRSTCHGKVVGGILNQLLNNLLQKSNRISSNSKSYWNMMIFSQKMLLKLFFWTRTIELWQRRQIYLRNARTFSSQIEKKFKKEKFFQKIIFFTKTILQTQKMQFWHHCWHFFDQSLRLFLQSPDRRKKRENSQIDFLKKVHLA